MRKLSLCALALLVVAAVAAAVATGSRRSARMVCKTPDQPHADGQFRVAIGVFSTKAEALALARHAAALQFKNLGIEIQVGPRYVVSLNGMHTRVQVNEEIAQVKHGKLRVVGVETELSPCR